MGENKHIVTTQAQAAGSHGSFLCCQLLILPGGHFRSEILLGAGWINGTAGEPADAQLCHSQ